MRDIPATSEQSFNQQTHEGASTSTPQVEEVVVQPEVQDLLESVAAQDTAEKQLAVIADGDQLAAELFPQSADKPQPKFREWLTPEMNAAFRKQAEDTIDRSNLYSITDIQRGIENLTNELAIAEYNRLFPKDTDTSAVDSTNQTPESFQAWYTIPEIREKFVKDAQAEIHAEDFISLPEYTNALGTKASELAQESFKTKYPDIPISSNTDGTRARSSMFKVYQP